LWENIIGTL